MPRLARLKFDTKRSLAKDILTSYRNDIKYFYDGIIANSYQTLSVPGQDRNYIK